MKRNLLRLSSMALMLLCTMSLSAMLPPAPTNLLITEPEPEKTVLSWDAVTNPDATYEVVIVSLSKPTERFEKVVTSADLPYELTRVNYGENQLLSVRAIYPDGTPSAWAERQYTASYYCDPINMIEAEGATMTVTGVKDGKEHTWYLNGTEQKLPVTEDYDYFYFTWPEKETREGAEIHFYALDWDDYASFEAGETVYMQNAMKGDYYYLYPGANGVKYTDIRNGELVVEATDLVPSFNYELVVSDKPLNMKQLYSLSYGQIKQFTATAADEDVTYDLRDDLYAGRPLYVYTRMNDQFRGIWYYAEFTKDLTDLQFASIYPLQMEKITGKWQAECNMADIARQVYWTDDNYYWFDAHELVLTEPSAVTIYAESDKGLLVGLYDKFLSPTSSDELFVGANKDSMLVVLDAGTYVLALRSSELDNQIKVNVNVEKAITTEPAGKNITLEYKENGRFTTKDMIYENSYGRYEKVYNFSVAEDAYYTFELQYDGSYSIDLYNVTDDSYSSDIYGSKSGLYRDYSNLEAGKQYQLIIYYDPEIAPLYSVNIIKEVRTDYPYQTLTLGKVLTETGETTTYYAGYPYTYYVFAPENDVWADLLFSRDPSEFYYYVDDPELSSSGTQISSSQHMLFEGGKKYYFDLEGDDNPAPLQILIEEHKGIVESSIVPSSKEREVLSAGSTTIDFTMSSSETWILQEDAPSPISWMKIYKFVAEEDKATILFKFLGDAKQTLIAVYDNGDTPFHMYTTHEGEIDLPSLTVGNTYYVVIGCTSPISVQLDLMLHPADDLFEEIEPNKTYTLDSSKFESMMGSYYYAFRTETDEYVVVDVEADYNVDLAYSTDPYATHNYSTNSFTYKTDGNTLYCTMLLPNKDIQGTFTIQTAPSYTMLNYDEKEFKLGTNTGLFQDNEKKRVYYYSDEIDVCEYGVIDLEAGDYQFEITAKGELHADKWVAMYVLPTVETPLTGNFGSDHLQRDKNYSSEPQFSAKLVLTVPTNGTYRLVMPYFNCAEGTLNVTKIDHNPVISIEEAIELAAAKKTYTLEDLPMNETGKLGYTDSYLVDGSFRYSTYNYYAQVYVVNDPQAVGLDITAVQQLSRDGYMLVYEYDGTAWAQKTDEDDSYFIPGYGYYAEQISWNYTVPMAFVVTTYSSDTESDYYYAMSTAHLDIINDWNHEGYDGKYDYSVRVDKKTIDVPAEADEAAIKNLLGALKLSLYYTVNDGEPLLYGPIDNVKSRWKIDLENQKATYTVTTDVIPTIYASFSAKVTVTLNIAQGIIEIESEDNTEIIAPVKRLENGQVVIYVGDMKYNIFGARIE